VTIAPRLKVLHCISSFQGGGAERQLSILAPAQAAHETVAIAFLDEGPHFPFFADGRVTLHRIARSGNRDPRIAVRLARLARSIRPDLIHTWLPQMDVAGGIVSKLLGIPWVMSERSYPTAYSAASTTHLLRRIIGRHANAVVANSESGQQFWAKQLRLPAKSYLVRNAPPLAEIAAARQVKPGMLGLRQGQRFILFVGRLVHAKNVELFLQVAQRVCAADEKVVFFVCGEGPLARLFRDVPSHNVDRIRLLGHRSDVWGLMKAASALITTSRFEGQPNAVIESMACGCPVVVSDIPAHREFLDARSAFICPLDKPHEFVDALLRVLREDPIVGARSVNAMRLAAQYGPAEAAAEYHEIYRSVSGRPQ
jgi:glycosyltransferase involved in cell wall biosynthesis